MARQNTRPATRRTGLAASVFLKCTALMAATTLIVALVMMVQEMRHTRQIAVGGILSLAAQSTRTAAEDLAAPVAFKAADRVEALIASTLEANASVTVSALVLDAGGVVLTNSGGSVSQAVQDAGRAALAQAASVTSPDGMIMAEPILKGENVLGSVVIEWTADRVMADISRQSTQQLLTTLAIFAVLTTLSTLLLRVMLSKPLQGVSEAIAAASEGTYDLNVPTSARSDEIGDISRNLETLLAKLQAARAAERETEKSHEEQNHVVQTLSVGLTAMAYGNLACRIDTPFPPTYEAIRSDFNLAVDNMLDVIRDVQVSAGTILSGAQDLSQSSDDLSRRTEAQSATLEETAAALEELSTNVASTSNGATEVATQVDDARNAAHTSSAVVRSAVEAMIEIGKSSNQVKDIISLIDDIAFQTNLLALNAGVEAARAGDAGKGFAVVASEVRALAQRSSDAARQIGQLIAGSSRQVEEGVVLAGKAGDTFQSISDRITEIANLVSGIAISAREQSSGLTEINSGMGELDQVTQSNAHMAEQTANSTHNLTSEAKQLMELVSRFQLDGAQDRARHSSRAA
ncbi:methyl-accepting chemotaxis protein [Mesobacterium pallidum]|uniref:methyl-accepting chemotaxis protein n=1 Tax=Mesobacterium pallidum TaxID=2872037 RepID=UPI001EE342EA|nr:methyl-accepting chemotaxis protein [Mesobacterium pallidum]